MKRTITIFLATAIITGTMAQLSRGSEYYQPKVSYYYYLMGLVHQREGKLGQSLDELQAALQLDPEATAIYRELILAYLSAGNTNQSVRLADRLKNITNTTANNLFLGSFYSLIKDTNTAIDCYETVLKKEPDNKEAIMFLAFLYSSINTQKSVNYWKKYLSLETESAEAYYQLALQLIKLDRNNEAIDMLIKSVNIDKENIITRTALAQLYEYEKEYLNSAKEYEFLVSADTGNPSLSLHTGVLYFNGADLITAEKHFQYTLGISPDDSSALLWMGLIKEQQKDWHAAIKYIENSMKLNPTVFGYIRLSLYYTQLQKPGIVIKKLLTALKISPDNYELHLMLGLAYMDMKKYAQAEKYLLQTIKLNPDYDETYYYIGTMYDTQKKYDKSEIYFKKLLELDPKNATALNYLGYLMADRNINLDEAEKLIKQALEIEPENPAYLDSLGWVYYRKGNTNSAEELITKASNKIEDPVLYDHLGDIKQTLNKTGEAIENYKKALKLDKRNPSIKNKLKKLVKK